MSLRLYVWQRLTAAIMVPLVLLHIAIIFYATRRGLSAADILARTRGSLTWALLYGTFVAAAAVHAAIGLRTVLIEWWPLNERAAAACAFAFAALLLALGLRAVAAVVLP
jgi:fumarate reductase subunit C